MGWRLDQQEHAWRARAACAHYDPELFFPESGPSPGRVICSRCPVQAECLAFALSSPWKPVGVWGGLPGYAVGALWAAHRRAIKQGMP